jgi:hypothetical protein
MSRQEIPLGVSLSGGGFREHLETHHDEEALWETLPERTSTVPTTFGRIDEETMACLVWHGYLSALCVAYAVLGYSPPPRLCDRTIHHFRRMSPRPPKVSRIPGRASAIRVT